MVVNVNQVSSSVPTTTSSNQTTSEPTESFQTVLMNAGSNSASVEANSNAKSEQVTDIKTEMTDSEKVEKAAAFVSDVFASNVSAEVINVEEDMTVQSLNVATETIGNLYEVVEVVVSELPEAVEPITDETDPMANLESTISVAFDEVISDLEGEAPTATIADVTQSVENTTVNAPTFENVDRTETMAAEVNVDENVSTNVVQKTGEQDEETISSNTQDVVDSSIVAQEVSTSVTAQTPVVEHAALKATNVQEYISNPTALQVVNRILENFENVNTFKNEISFVLNPASLGRVAVRMVVERGTLTVELAASSKNTQNILAENLESIREVLRNIAVDNQVNEILDHGQENYLEDRNNQNSQNRENEEPERNNDSDNQYTEDFLSMLNFMNSEEI